MPETLHKAYLSMLGNTVHEQDSFMRTCHVEVPIRDDGRLNYEDAFLKRFVDFVFPDKRTGYEWFQGRIDAVFSEKGEYYGRIRDGGFDYVVEALKQMKMGKFPFWNSNRFIISLFKPEDLHKNRVPIPPCLISLSFYPIKNRELMLVGTFRAQYVDAKGFGNIVSLAMLLDEVCQKTGFKPSSLYNVAQKTILKYDRDTARRFYFHLLRET